jgi:hypothetical protein
MVAECRTSLKHREVAMSIVRVGTTKKYADGWDAIFGGRKKSGGAKAKAGGRTAKKKTGRRKK